MKRKKEDYVVIGFGVVLVLVIFAIAYVTVKNQRAGEKPTPTPEPTLAKTQPLPSALPNSGKKPLYNNSAQDRLVDYAKNRRPLAESDRVAKAKLLTLLPSGQQSGVIHTSKNIIIDYTHSADLFQVEIVTTAIQTAQNEAILWFLSQGMSQQGICYLPLGFYLNFDIAQQLKKTNTKGNFSPLASGC